MPPLQPVPWDQQQLQHLLAGMHQPHFYGVSLGGPHAASNVHTALAQACPRVAAATAPQMAAATTGTGASVGTSVVAPTGVILTPGHDHDTRFRSTKVQESCEDAKKWMQQNALRGKSVSETTHPNIYKSMKKIHVPSLGNKKDLEKYLCSVIWDGGRRDELLPAGVKRDKQAFLNCLGEKGWNYNNMAFAMDVLKNWLLFHTQTPITGKRGTGKEVRKERLAALLVEVLGVN